VYSEWLDRSGDNASNVCGAVGLAREGGFAIDPRDFLGARHEFVSGATHGNCEID
jgi:hypothetical protein